MQITNKVTRNVNRKASYKQCKLRNVNHKASCERCKLQMLQIANAIKICKRCKFSRQRTLGAVFRQYAHHQTHSRFIPRSPRGHLQRARQGNPHIILGAKRHERWSRHRKNQKNRPTHTRKPPPKMRHKQEFKGLLKGNPRKHFWRI